MSTTPPAPPPGPPPAPPPGPPSGPPSAPPPGAARPAAAPPKKSGGGGIWLVLFIVAAVLFVGALVFAIISFTGKNSEADDKEKAQTELAQTKKQLQNTQGELGTQKGAGQVLGRLVNTGEGSADALKACTDSGFQLRENIVSLLNAVQANTNVDALVDGINAQINQNDSVCNNSNQQYQDFKDAVNQIRNR
jgi:flagellar basal body-associated protein FliL